MAGVAAPGKFNYLRTTSTDAGARYRAARDITSAEFGTTRYAGKVSFIHIDGNHDYACVKADYETWRPLMLPGGWIILDDYVWQHGDGPRRLGDEVLQAERDHFQRAFVAGKALFLQLK